MTPTTRASLRPPRWVLLLLTLGLVLVASVLYASRSGLLYYHTGEEELLSQIRAIGHLASGYLRPRPETANYVPVQHAGMNPMGINTFLEQEVELEKRERAVAMIADAGFYWLRQEFPWEDIEIHAKGDFTDRRADPARSSWEKYDNIVDLAEQYGLELIVRLSNPPAWSRAAGNEGGSLAPPDDFEDFGDYVATVVERYQGRIRYYQIWNEPNIYPEWGEKPVDPEAYVELLRIAYERAKAIDPDVVIICGALAATIQNDLYPHGMSDLVYLQRLYDAGAGAYFDVLSMQGYGLWSGPYDRRMRPRVLNFSRPLYVRDIMVRNGDSHKPIWISEMNWNAIPLDHPAYPMFGRYSLEVQARYVVQAYERIQREWPWLGVANLWYFKRATDLEQDQPMYYFRMVEPNFTPMPLYGAVQTYAQEPPVLGLGLHQEDHWALLWEGDWQEREAPEAQLGRYRTLSAGLVSARWRGSSLTLRASGPATLSVVSDDAEPHTVIVPDDWGEVTVVSGLADAEHNTRITLVDGSLSLDGIAARRSSREGWAALGIGTLLVAGVAWAFCPRRRGERVA